MSPDPQLLSPITFRPYVVAAYQPLAIEDKDPQTELNFEAGTVNTPPRIFVSAIFLEMIRERVKYEMGQPDYEAVYQKRLDNVVSHEIGHVPGQLSGPSNHAEMGLMSEDPFGEFSPKSLLRFRVTSSWAAHW
jgi:hypothetical protein